MFSPEEVLLEHGLVGAFDTMVMMHDEEIAIFTTPPDSDQMSTYLDFEGVSESELDIGNTSVMSVEANETIQQQGVTFLELQMFSQELSAHLYHRFGVRKGDLVALFCHGHAAAEVNYTQFN
jgi:hypothetical protein